MIVSIVYFLAMARKRLKWKDDRTVMAVLIPSSIYKWAQKEVILLLKDKNGNLNQETVIFASFWKFAQFQWSMRNTDVKYYSDEKRFNEYVNTITAKLSSAQKNTGPKNPHLPLRFV